MMQPETIDWLPTPDMTALAAGELYVEHGFRVCIVHTVVGGRCTCGAAPGGCKRGKHPVITAWQKKVYATKEQFRDALGGKRIPEAPNLGIVMGEQLDGRYIIAIDGDVPERLAALEAALGPLPPTLVARTGGGGSHRLYALAPGQDPRRGHNRVGLRLATEPPSPGVDVRWTGGQVVVAPSLHESGNRYSWSTTLPIAELPQAWFDVIADPIPEPRRPASSRGSRPAVSNLNERYIREAIRKNAEDMAGRGKGERNAVLFSKTCTLLEYCAGAGLSFDLVLEPMQESGLACGLPRAEVNATLRKAERQVRTTGKTRTPPDLPERAPPIPAAPTASSRGSQYAPPDEDGDAEDPDAWLNEFARTRSGVLKPTLRNVCLIFRNDPRYKGRFSFNRMRVTPYVDGRPLKDADIARFREEIERDWYFAPGAELVTSAIMLIADECSFHPVQDYLNGLVWDGEKRIERVAREVLGHEAPTDLTQRMLRAWFVSAVARALRPGCKVDTTMVLRGDQGFKKSTFFAVLGGEFFTDTYVDIRNKDGLLQVHAAWLYEWGEIERVTTRTSSSDVKAFLTSARDDVRPPYGRGIVNHPRSSVIVGTTNKPFLDDETGSRRFWPIWVHKLVDIDVLRAWRDQLWAEALAALNAGEEWWLDQHDEASRDESSDDHMVENPWLEKIAGWLAEGVRRTSGVTTADVVVGALGIDIGKERGEATRVGKILRRLRWWPRQEMRHGARVRVYYPETSPRLYAQHHRPQSDEVVHREHMQNQGGAQHTQHEQPISRGKSESVDGEHHSRENKNARARTPAPIGKGGEVVQQVVQGHEMIETDCTTSEEVVHAFSDLLDDYPASESDD